MEDNEIMSIEATGKSVDEAIFKGLTQLGISIDEVSIEILRTETKGILGIGAKPAIVRLTRKPSEEIDISELLSKSERPEKPERNERRERRERKLFKDRHEKAEKPEKAEKNERPEEAKKPEKTEKNEKPARPEEAKKPEKTEKNEKPARPERQENPERPARPEKPEKQEKPRESISREIIKESAEPDKQEKAEKQEKPERPARPEKQEKSERPARQERAPRENRPRRQEKPAEAVPETDEAPEEPEKIIEYTLEAAEGNPAAEFVKGLIRRMGAEGQVLAAKDEDCLRLRIDSEMMGMLIGHRGETLDAMQYLTGLVINKNRKTEGYTRVTLNTEEYREKREETLKRLAKKVAAQVKATGRPRVLEPMNPYERRVLHSTLQSNPDVTTHSEGEEPNRRVVVTPKRRGRSGYSRSRGSRRSSEPRAERRPRNDFDEGDSGTISREEYEKLYEAAKAASPMFMGAKKED